ncbi:hypothetical protein A411_0339 [Listeria monocytogenes serotype 1/2a str. 10-0812]|nr:hypothetical protein A411_0339 [Listeria monocytogenes serotype 1/2a str. 10-0812]
MEFCKIVWNREKKAYAKILHSHFEIKKLRKEKIIWFHVNN